MSVCAVFEYSFVLIFTYANETPPKVFTMYRHTHQILCTT